MDKDKHIVPEKHLRTLFNTSPHIIILFDSSFKIVDCNPEAIRFIGFNTLEEMLTGFEERIVKSIPEYQSNGRRSIPITERFAAAAKDGICKFETEIILDGERRNLRVELIRIPYEDSFAISAFVLNITDIRDKEKELTLAQELNQLQLSKLDMVVQATKIGLWETEILNDDLTNPENAFIWSDEFRNMLGFSDETDFPNVLGSWSERLHPEDRAETLEHAMKHLLDKTGKTPYDAEYRLLKKDGEYAHFRSYGGTFRDQDGNAMRMAGSIMDITETKNTLINNELQLTKLDLMVKATKIGL